MEDILIKNLEEERFKAIVERRYEDFAKLAHPEMTYTHTSGVTDSKESYLDKLFGGFYDYKWIKHPISKIQIIGEVALVFGEMHSELVAGNIQKSLRNKSLAIWRKENNAWLFYAYQPTPLP
ncbi:nuclear transport factor 2 family protein [Acinetobacter bohemicus]|uniref:nuclear transport factor 2 family protein n=1 Tax=Acinetobacter TaxID=469 RepID=UPI00209AAF0B|nr:MULTISPECIES: nuclear transport factor 2 family protein [Acinetobacter]MCO8045136.1 nuclear transport factor 2 family protein [Acinetobacter sp. S4397-1]MCU7226043.1 nuclear transport factor 2 family protein [Acinetobacter bohemicus]